MFEKLEGIEKRYNKIDQKLADPAIFSDQPAYQALVKERSKLTEFVEQFRKYKESQKRIEEARQILASDDDELKELANEELVQAQSEADLIKNKLEERLLEDPDADRNIIIEIRAGTGGDEAGLFAADLFRMYSHYARNQGWAVEVMNTNSTGLGGIKEIVFGIAGSQVYKKMRYESGTHRVQRVPVTETSGRIHTSAVTVAVLPEPEDVEVQLQAKDLKVDVYRSSGPGGQSVNTTDSAVRITYIPTGLVVTCQDEKSQLQNKAKAMRILKARLLEESQKKQQRERARDRKEQIGSGDRSGRIRTYNFPESRVTDHRIGLTLYNLGNILEGDLEEVTSALILYYRQERLKATAQE
ncbi:MAG: peptide chain release factor 1 [Candidatus Omnitrophica bacterium]|nr:peptide chain release factor 1 [Candidatus Omnitrophota bacterium]